MKIIPTYDEALVCIQNEVNDPFVMVVGAMDGRMFDPIYPYVYKYHWKGLFIEPLPDLFEKLKKVYPHASELSSVQTQTEGTSFSPSAGFD